MKIFLFVLILTGQSLAATWYVGPFTTCHGTSCAAPVNATNCGSPGNGPCPDLPLFNLYHGNGSGVAPVAPGDIVRFTGTFQLSVGSTTTGNCIIPANGVIMEGRLANDTAPAVGVYPAIVDGINNPSSGSDFLCQGGTLYYAGHVGTAPSNFQVNNFKFTNSKGVVGSGNSLYTNNPAQMMTDFQLNNVWFKSNNSRFLVGSVLDNTENIRCRSSGYNTKRFKFTDVIMEDNLLADNTAALLIGCVDNEHTIQLERVKITKTWDRDLTEGECSAQVGSCPCAAAVEPCNHAGGSRVVPHTSCQYCECLTACDDHDGIQTGGKNAVWNGVEVSESGEDGMDLGGVGSQSCDAPETGLNLVIDRANLHDNPRANYSSSHCASKITVKNSVIYGKGSGFNFYACSYDQHFWNNTVVLETRYCQGASTNNGTLCDEDTDCPGGFCSSPTVVQAFENNRRLDFKNNLFIGRAKAVGNPSWLAFFDYASTNQETIWRDNVFVNTNGVASPIGLHEDQGNCTSTPGDCDCKIGDPGGCLANVCNPNICVGGPFNLIAGCNSNADCGVGGVCSTTQQHAGTCSGTPVQSCCWNAGEGPLGTADCPAGQVCQDAACDPQHPGFAPGWNNVSSNIIANADGEATFASQSAAGKWFSLGGSPSPGPMGVLPTFFSGAWDPNVPPSIVQMHLSSTDTVARNKGIDLTSFGVISDFDTEFRPFGSVFDIGFDETQTGSSGTTSTNTTTSTTTGTGTTTTTFKVGLILR